MGTGDSHPNHPPTSPTIFGRLVGRFFATSLFITLSLISVILVTMGPSALSYDADQRRRLPGQPSYNDIMKGLIAKRPKCPTCNGEGTVTLPCNTYKKCSYVRENAAVNTCPKCQSTEWVGKKSECMKKISIGPHPCAKGACKKPCPTCQLTDSQKQRKKKSGGKKKGSSPSSTGATLRRNNVGGLRFAGK